MAPVRKHPQSPSRSIEEADILFDRRVGKSGAVCISGLAQGTRVHVAHVRPGVYLVSPLPEDDVRRIIAQIPQPPQSPYSALIHDLADRKRTPEPKRKHNAFTGEIRDEQPSTEATLARAQLQKPSRPPR